MFYRGNDLLVAPEVCYSYANNVYVIIDLQF
jgi:hypothetical protein